MPFGNAGISSVMVLAFQQASIRLRTSSTGSWPGLDLVADSVADLVSVWDSLIADPTSI
ncbi:MAG: hypothetical protein E6Z02_01675 [Bifidobacterium breve]|nr:hypothetical protein [Bifidobacterium breve]